MELIDLVRGRWLALAIAAPVIAGVVVLSLLSTSAEERFEASATVAVPQAISGDLNQAGLRTVLGDFTNTFTSLGAAEDVARIVGGSQTQISTGASSVPAGEGSEVIVTLEGMDPVLVEEQLKMLTEIALAQLASDEVENAAINRRAAERQLDNAITGLASIEAEAGTTDLLNEYRQRSAEVQGLRTEIARSFEAPALQDALEDVLAKKQAEADELSVLVTQWELQRNQANEASTARGLAEREEFRAESKLERVGADIDSLRVQIQPASSVTDAGVPVIAAMAIALVAVVVTAIIWRRREVDDEQLTEAELDDDDFGLSEVDDLTQVDADVQAVG